MPLAMMTAPVKLLPAVLSAMLLAAPAARVKPLCEKARAEMPGEEEAVVESKAAAWSCEGALWRRLS